MLMSVRPLTLVLVFLLAVLGSTVVMADTVPRVVIDRDLLKPTLPPGVVLELPEVPRTRHELPSGLMFHMRLAPASTYPIRTVNGSAAVTVDNNVWLGETEVPYELWYEVRGWAARNGYVFANNGKEGSHGNVGRPPSDRSQEPVTEISWRDSIVWCNALSELLGFDPVYTYRGDVLRDATQAYACDHAVQESQDGFRLPTASEWVMAHRYRDGENWASEDYASGATDDWQNESATQLVAWYVSNSGYRTHDVGQKRANPLYLHDMSGNVWEYVYDHHYWGAAKYGGGFSDEAVALLVGAGVDIAVDPAATSLDRGLRLAKTFFLRLPVPDIRIPDVKLP